MVTSRLGKRLGVWDPARLIRLGGLLPPLGAAATLAALRVLDGGRVELAVAVGALALAGQAMVWIGVLGLRKMHGAPEEVKFQLIVGGVLTALTVFLTRVPELMVLPLGPLVAGVLAQRQSHRRTRRGEG